jgi:hypothetical protein
VTTFAGFNCIQNKGCSQSPYADGVGTSASFGYPDGLVFRPSASPSTGAGTLYVAISGFSTIRAITVSGKPASAGKTATLAGNAALCENPDPTSCDGNYASGGYADGVGSNALFLMPHDVAVSGSNALLVADWFNNVIRKVFVSGGSTGTVVTFAGGFAVTPSPSRTPGYRGFFSSLRRGDASPAAHNAGASRTYPWVIEYSFVRAGSRFMRDGEAWARVATVAHG